MRAKDSVSGGAFTQEPSDEKCKMLYQVHGFAGGNQWLASYVIHCLFNSEYESKMRNNVISRFNTSANGAEGSRQRVRICGKRIFAGGWGPHTTTPNANPV
jgi:hypothetical protein